MTTIWRTAKRTFVSRPQTPAPTRLSGGRRRTAAGLAARVVMGTSAQERPAVGTAETVIAAGRDAGGEADLGRRGMGRIREPARIARAEQTPMA